MLSVNEALAIISATTRESLLSANARVRTPITDRAPLILNEPLKADRPMPPFDRVAMDGIAIARRDWLEGCREFRVAGIVRAGEAPKPLERPGECLEVMTGAVLPAQADAVVRYEDVILTGGMARINDGVLLKPSNHIHRAGSDAVKGQAICSAGALFTPPLVAVAASIGNETILSARPPRVAFVSTGDELVAVGETPQDFQIRQSNAYAIGAALGRVGVQTFERHHARDDDAALLEVLTQALATADIVLVSGGVSAGKFDLVPKILGELGVKEHFHKVRQRPGKPLWFGQGPLGQRVFGLPGNPMSSLVCAYRYVLPMIQAELQGCAVNELPRSFARLDPKSPALGACELTRFVPVSLRYDRQAVTWATPVSHQGSGDYASLVHSAGFIEVPADGLNTDPEMGYPFYSWQNLWM